ncbi:hypothetical protein NEF87_000848 [Candidatus Lokiarchaeum ossiferum]|uniref:Uncharacterized protein n=1 Tax=Candidatus Lokiarchaeum ossiferum TaxID=2951803 RepID=A0ABY6HM30_9ARCH|nr:hypothetical protein NEF87_000848 [Candidatus Lokiarchaeum sp. B-35]
MSMYRKYLLKNNFWPQSSNNGSEPNCYVKHEIHTGGIYAYIQHRGVKIIANNETQFFNNFKMLDEYLDELSVKMRNETSDLMKIINRRTTSNMLRQIPL